MSLFYFSLARFFSLTPPTPTPSPSTTTFSCTHVCMHECKYVSIYVCTCVSEPVHTFKWVCACAYQSIDPFVIRMPTGVTFLYTAVCLWLITLPINLIIYLHFCHSSCITLTECLFHTDTYNSSDLMQKNAKIYWFSIILETKQIKKCIGICAEIDFRYWAKSRYRLFSLFN